LRSPLGGLRDETQSKDDVKYCEIQPFGMFCDLAIPLKENARAKDGATLNRPCVSASNLR
jgi:hypothetical protein